MDERDNQRSYYSDANTPFIRSRYKIIWFAFKLLVIATILVIRFKPFSVERSYERTWKIKFANCVVLAEDHKPKLFSDDKYRYTVFDVKRLMRYLQVYNNYQNEFDDTCEEVMNHFGDEVIERPDYDRELTYLSMVKDGKELIMLYSPDEYRLYCFIHPV